ncbi:DUF2817 domain-containing protein [Variovorax sp. OV700]|uniref:DUF2817 domain-containing protein n=1 Tax=Variovorax sp. OV700 TaxID=1882826 RepID=UPI0026762B68|nr:DUF2817 domain-containing protein [Variovorax sp. OV700]
MSKDICGSGCQTAMLSDEVLLKVASQRGVDLLFLHAVNPHGFSYLRRANEGNVDLNRNFIDFSKRTQQPANLAYAELHQLLLPPAWPPSADISQAIGSYIAKHGVAAYRRAATTGRHSHQDGIFCSGSKTCWSNLVVRSLLRRHASRRPAMAWIDLHTGLGPSG